MVELREPGSSGAGSSGRGASPPVAGRPSRRGFLATAGLSALSVAVAGTFAGDVHAARSGVFSSGTGDAYAPWGSWEQGAAPLRLVRAAILAANAHNAQAWRFAVSPQRIDVHEDVDRSLGTVDPYRREIHLSAGCAVENLVLAASASGLAATVTLRPTADRTLLARVDLSAARSSRSPLYPAIPHRHTDRGAYQAGRAVPGAAFASMDALVDVAIVRVRWLTTPAERSAFTDATVAATESFVADAGQSADDYAWYRGTWAQVQSHRDGVTADAGGLTPALRALGKMVPAARASNDRYWLSGTRDRQLPTAAAFGMILVEDPADVVQRVAAGRVYERLQLWTTTQAMVMQPLNQLVERAERERSTTGAGPAAAALAALVSDASWQAVMPFRIGYPTGDAPASPRRAVDDVLIVAR